MSLNFLLILYTLEGFVNFGALFGKRLAGVTVTKNCTYFQECTLSKLLILYQFVTGQKS